jgi:transcription elongation GreA/GreB family factor
MAELPAKREVLAALRARISEDLEVIIQSQKEAQEGATHEEARAEGDKDMRSTETSYLARGLAQRVSDLRAAAAKLANMALRRFSEEDPIEVGALLELEDDDDNSRLYFLAPAGGGLEVKVASQTIRVITPQAPLGTALLGKELDDDIELSSPGGTRTLVITALA